MITGGIDEAGRGPVIGPMVIVFVCFDEDKIGKLQELGVRDSKQISPKRREFLEKEIKNIALEYIIFSISAKEIDSLMKKFSLNEIEAIHISKIISNIKNKDIIDKIFIDSPDNIPNPIQGKGNKFKDRIVNLLQKKNLKVKFDIIAENHADSKYIECSAASILAKVERDREIEKLRKIFGDFGSGYPSDERTIEFLKEEKNRKNMNDFIRHSWNLKNNNIKKENQLKLLDF